jgi:hypothetical protein
MAPLRVVKLGDASLLRQDEIGLPVTLAGHSFPGMSG